MRHINRCGTEPGLELLLREGNIEVAAIEAEVGVTQQRRELCARVFLRLRKSGRLDAEDEDSGRDERSQGQCVSP